MMNTIRADFYRITRSWHIFVGFGVIALISALQMIGIGLGIGITDTYQVVLNGSTSTSFLNTLTPFLVVGVMSMAYTIGGPIFQDKAAKNEVAWGASRTKLYISRMISIALLCIAMMILYIGLGMLIATIMNGFGVVQPGFWSDFFIGFMGQTLLMIITGWMGIFLTFTIKNGFVVFEIFGALVAWPILLSMILSFTGIELGRVLNFDMLTSIARLGDFGAMTQREILYAVGVGLVWLILSTVLGLVKFNRAEIK